MFSTFPKLMAMSSYMVNSKYVDPKFPPCEEYLQGSYLGEQGGPDYYGAASQGSDFQQPPAGLYPRSGYGEQAFGCGNAPGAAVQPRGHGQEPSGPPPAHFPGQAEHCPPPPPSMPASRACSQQENHLKSPNGAALKQPAVVYPWMKKVHVNSGKRPSPARPTPPPAAATFSTRERCGVGWGSEGLHRPGHQWFWLRNRPLAMWLAKGGGGRRRKTPLERDAGKAPASVGGRERERERLKCVFFF